ncbi:cytochrome C [Geobacter sp. SVR]|uniref:c-type cytochrome n=1 Tax=Geobacter sp. SVR TaxID=2495594 RepID=UPI00143EF568|nr:cytochrome C [Geobacter sp. SVR]BCS54203.1 hypothetical protein GSVR_25110 [Geobacter sp. SVR]GCF85938.1 hypothetical protein GSbR_25380 [Geobacter sp. SVR]
MKKAILAVVALFVLFLAGLYAVVLYNGPRMTVQPHIRAFQAILPPLPAGVATVEPPDRLPEAGQAARDVSPLESSSTNRERGRIYYHYYCVFCHGEQGAGDGPVGQSYQPVPADLHSARIGRYGDGQLLRAMLTGIGHEPVLERVVPPGHRWYLVQYVRWLGSGKTGS